MNFLRNTLRTKRSGILASIALMTLVLSGQAEPSDFAARAVIEEGFFVENQDITTVNHHRSIFEDLVFYEVCEKYSEPSRCAFVVHCANRYFVFYSLGNSSRKNPEELIVSNHYLRMAEQYSEITHCGNLTLTPENIHRYLEIFTEIVDYKSKPLDNVEEVRFLPPHLRENLDLYKDSIISPRINFQNNQFSLVFYSWKYFGYILKWNLLVEKNGQITSCNVEEIMDLSF